MNVKKIGCSVQMFKLGELAKFRRDSSRYVIRIDGAIISLSDILKANEITHCQRRNQLYEDEYEEKDNKHFQEVIILHTKR